MTIYVGNSIDGYEEGPLGLLEAMACGVPIVTTPSGVANDIIEDQVNGLLVNFQDKIGLKIQIKKLMEDAELRKNLRESAWETVKNMTDKKMAWEYGNLYDKIYYTDDLVSIIIPFTIKDLDNVNKTLKSLTDQTYKNFEVVLALDEPVDLEDESKIALRHSYNFSIKFICTGNSGYGLAQARNMAAIEANGKYLLFLDSRIQPEKDAIEKFIEANKIEMLKSDNPKKWLFGDKGGGKKSFVENFSFINRKDFFTFGMFNERIDAYGGLSQETRTRWTLQGGIFKFIQSVKSIQLTSSKKSSERRKDIANTKFKLLKIYHGDNF